jgi:hypothetical protein
MAALAATYSRKTQRGVPFKIIGGNTLTDDCKPTNLQEGVQKGVSSYGETQQVRDSQTTAKPAHLSQPTILAIPPLAPVQPVQQSSTGASGSTEGSGNQKP